MAPRFLRPLPRQPEYLLAGTTVVLAVLSAVGLAVWERSPYQLVVGRLSIPYDHIHIAGLTFFSTFVTLAVCALYLLVSTILHNTVAAATAKLGQPNDDTNSSGGSATAAAAMEVEEHDGATAVVVADRSPLSFSSSLSTAQRLWLAAGLYAASAAALVVLGVVAAAVWAHDPLFRCGVIFCLGPPGTYPNLIQTQPTNGQSFNATVGMMSFFTLVPIGLIMGLRLLALRTTICSLASGTATTTALPASSSTNNDSSAHDVRVMAVHRGRPNAAGWAHDLLLGVLPAAVLLIACAVFSFYLPNDTRRYRADRIAASALLQATYGTSSGNFTAPEAPRAWFRTRNLRVSEYLVLKLFPGNVFFYAYLLLVVFTMWALRLTVLGRTWLRAPTGRFWPLQGWNHGDAMLSCLTGLFACLFFWYWAHDHNYKRTWSESRGPDSSGLVQLSELWGRATGQLAIFFLSLLMFPASRSSSLPLFRTMGVSWESFLWAHRMLGYAMLAATLAHVIFFLRNYYVNGNLWKNLTSQPAWVGKKGVRNDYTMDPITWATLLMFIFMGGFAYHGVRRRCFELFYYSHLIGSYILFPIVLWHASSGWEYMLPGLTLWVLDRFVRLYRSGAPVKMLRAVTVDSQTVRIDFLCGEGSGYGAGQFVFLNVPEVSLLEWHPFTTLATSAVDGVAPDQVECSGGGGTAAVDDGGRRLTVLAKVMGTSRSSWTAKLYSRVAAAQFGTAPDFNSNSFTRNSGNVNSDDSSNGGGGGGGRKVTPSMPASPARPAGPAPFTLRIDGPCGCPLDSTEVSDYDSVFLVAGGIGAVPCLALYQSLRDQYDHRSLQQQQQPLKRPFPKRVKFIWVSRSVELVESVGPMLFSNKPSNGAGGGVLGGEEGEGEDTTRFESSVFLTSAPSAYVTSPTTRYTGDCEDGTAIDGDGGSGGGGGGRHHRTFTTAVVPGDLLPHVEDPRACDGDDDHHHDDDNDSGVALPMPEGRHASREGEDSEETTTATTNSMPATPTKADAHDRTGVNARCGGGGPTVERRCLAGPPPPLAVRRARYSQGRPDWLRELAATVRRDVPYGAAEVAADGVVTMESGGSGGGGRVLVFACGPSKLTREVRAITEELGVAFHREEFNL